MSNSDQLALFNQYDSEYCSKATQVANSIQKIKALSGEQRRGKIQDVEAELKEAERIIKRMEMEARSFAPAVSGKLLGKVRDYRADLTKLQQEVKTAGSAASGGTAARSELGLGDDFYSTSSGQRERMLQSTDKLARTGDRINQGRQQLLETEATGVSILEDLHRQRQTIERSRAALQSSDELGVSILQDLHRQRETIVHSRDVLHGADDNISRARRTLASMSRRIVTNKIIMIGIILLLLAAIILVLYFKIIKGN